MKAQIQSALFEVNEMGPMPIDGLAKVMEWLSIAEDSGRELPPRVAEECKKLVAALEAMARLSSTVGAIFAEIAASERVVN